MNLKLILGVVVAVIAVVGSFYYFAQIHVTPTQQEIITQGIVIDNLTNGEEITSPFTLKGYINGNGWVAYNGECGTVELTATSGDQITVQALNATSDWQAAKVEFEAKLSFQLANNIDGFIVLHNKNITGNPDNDKLLKIPVKIKATVTEINFDRVGNVVINNPGLIENVPYLSYETPGKPAQLVKLVFDSNSCSTICPTFSNGERVRISGLIVNNAVYIRKVEKQ